MCNSQDIACQSNCSVIYWQPTTRKPENASYILLKYLDKSGDILCTNAAYENGLFLFYYGEKEYMVFQESQILGWSYFPFDDRLDKKREG